MDCELVCSVCLLFWCFSNSAWWQALMLHNPLSKLVQCWSPKQQHMCLCLTCTTVMIDSALVTRPLLLYSRHSSIWMVRIDPSTTRTIGCMYFSHCFCLMGFNLDLAAVHEPALCFWCSTSSLIFTNISSLMYFSFLQAPL